LFHFIFACFCKTKKNFSLHFASFCIHIFSLLCFNLFVSKQKTLFFVTLLRSFRFKTCFSLFRFDFFASKHFFRYFASTFSLLTFFRYCASTYSFCPRHVCCMYAVVPWEITMSSAAGSHVKRPQ
jgi:hypothetical protein